MKNIFQCIAAAGSRAAEAARLFWIRHACAGTMENKGRLIIKRNVSVDLRGNGYLHTGTGTVSLQQGSRIIVEDGGRLIIGDDVGINANCYIAVHNEVRIGNNTIFGPGVVVVDQDHDYKAEGGLKAEKYKVGKVEIGNNVWIGANAVILRDTVIGDNAVIGAGCVVKGDIPCDTVYTGRR